MDLILSAALAVVEYMVASAIYAIDPNRWQPRPTVTALLIVHYLAAKYYRVFLYHRYISPLRHLPGPDDNHPFFGQAINLLKAKSPPELYVKWMRQFPDAPFIRYLSFANTEILLCNSLESHKGVLQTNCYSFQKPDRWRRMMTEITGAGIVGLEGDEHHRHRRMLAGVFSVNNVRKLEPVFQSKAKELTSLLGEYDASKNGLIDCTDVFSKATLDIIGLTIMGVELSNLKSVRHKDGGDRQWNLKHAVRAVDYTFHDAYEVIFAASMLGKILFFANGFLPTRWIPVEANREFKFATTWLRQVITKLIQDRYRDFDEARRTGKYEVMKQDSRDLLSFLVEESIPGGPAEGIQLENFLGHILQLMAAGHATSADTLSWAVYIMATRHDIQERLHAEIGDLLSRHPDLTFLELDALPYLNNFVKEALRLYAPSTSHHRQAAQDMTIDGIFIPMGTTIDIVPAVPMLNPLIWGEDAEEPRPERWDQLSTDQSSPYAYEVFSNGPRMCIGKSYAMMEIKIILVEMIRRFRFLDVNQDFTIENPGFALRPCGMEVRLEKRVL